MKSGVVSFMPGEVSPDFISEETLNALESIRPASILPILFAHLEEKETVVNMELIKVIVSIL